MFMVYIEPVLNCFSKLALSEEDAHYCYVLNQKQLLKLRFMRVTRKSATETTRAITYIRQNLFDSLIMLEKQIILLSGTSYSNMYTFVRKSVTERFWRSYLPFLVAQNRQITIIIFLFWFCGTVHTWNLPDLKMLQDFIWALVSFPVMFTTCMRKMIGGPFKLDYLH